MNKKIDNIKEETLVIKNYNSYYNFLEKKNILDYVEERMNYKFIKTKEEYEIIELTRIKKCGCEKIHSFNEKYNYHCQYISKYCIDHRKYDVYATLVQNPDYDLYKPSYHKVYNETKENKIKKEKENQERKENDLNFDKKVASYKIYHEPECYYIYKNDITDLEILPDLKEKYSL